MTITADNFSIYLAAACARAAAWVACGGAALLILGLVLSTIGGTSKTLSLTRNGPPARAAGWQFAYRGRENFGPGRETFRLLAKCGAVEIETPIGIEFTKRGPVRKPYILSSLLRDVYISPVDTGDVVLTPTATVTDEGWVSLPFAIPGTGATLSLLGLQVKSGMAKLRYTPARGKPADLEVAKGKPAVVDGIRLEFVRLMVNSSHDMSTITAGADVSASGRGIRDRVVVEVSAKPLISLLWLGSALILLGGVMALLGRRVDNGILPDSN